MLELEGKEGEQIYSSTFSLTSALQWVGGQSHAPANLHPVVRPGTHRTGVWVGPRAGLGVCGKSRPPPGFDHQTVYPGASLYTVTVKQELFCGTIFRVSQGIR
jgi:hypothetical protein